jgi:hypothetical protein
LSGRTARITRLISPASGYGPASAAFGNGYRFPASATLVDIIAFTALSDITGFTAFTGSSEAAASAALVNRGKGGHAAIAPSACTGDELSAGSLIWRF